MVRKRKKSNKTRLRNIKKRRLGAFIIIAFIAFFALLLTEYLVAWDVSFQRTALVSLSVSLLLLLVMEVRSNLKKRK